MGSLRVLKPAEEDPGDGGRGARLDLAAVRDRLAEARGPAYWRSLEELAGSPEFEDLLHREFPRHAAFWPGDPDGVSRRRFLQLSSASLALAGLAACTRQPPEKIVPYIHQPEDLVPGKPLFFATASILGGFASPLLAESQMGRPIKMEGNPGHPASLGATDRFAQASVLGLYDPDRAQAIRHYGRLETWASFAQEMASVATALGGLRGAGLRILSGTVTSPSLAARIGALLQRFPEARWHRWEPVGRHSAALASRAAFGEPVDTIYDLTKADVVLTLESDLLTSGPGNVRYARDFADRRRGNRPAGVAMNRLYAVESTPTNTGTMAEHRLVLPPRQVGAFVAALAAELGVQGAAPPAGLANVESYRWVKAVAADLRAHRGRSAVVAGDYAAPEVHVLAHAINQSLGNVGEAVLHVEPVEADPQDPVGSLEELVHDMRADKVTTLVVLGGNPVFDAPADLDFAGALDQVSSRRIYVGLYDNETAERCHWHIPESHDLESWGDARSYDGTVTLLQPLLEPLYDSRTHAQVLATLDGQPAAADYDLLEAYWRGQGLDAAAFRKAIHDGFLPGTAAARKAVVVAPAAVAEAASRAADAAAQEGEGIDLIFRPDPTIWDGRFANNGWLQELPKPLTKLTWDNALVLAPAAAERLGVSSEDVVEVVLGESRLVAPVWVLPGQSPKAATLHFGLGRRRTGRVGSGVGVDVYPLRTSDALWGTSGAHVDKRPGRYPMATTQDHHSMEGRHQVRSATLAAFERDPTFAQKMEHVPEPDESLYPPYAYTGYAWGLTVDLAACTGCNACVVACQAENNIPVVGKDQVLNGREMHWIRIDRYYEGSLDNPVLHHQPVMCQQCEDAPCELVCPVEATLHSSEGLNDMVYNRCVGTRYCSNNCPYKVRRFNFLEYNRIDAPIEKMQKNPDVTVRSRGVMEKCTYCVQRINHARQDAKVQGRKITDGEVRTACQQVCPAGAIVFGDLNDPKAAVVGWKELPLNYQLLAEINTRPRTSYLAKVKNPNPELERA